MDDLIVYYLWICA